MVEESLSPRTPSHLHAWKLLGVASLSIALYLSARFEGQHRTALETAEPSVDVMGALSRSSNHDAVPLQECRPRNGWPHVFSKLDGTSTTNNSNNTTNSSSSSAAKSMTVAFMGGSITAKVDCWVPQTTDMLRRLYPDVTWTGINAGVGGTGAHWGAFRLEKDVTAYQPDLIFLEFAVNDHAMPRRVSAPPRWVGCRTRREPLGRGQEAHAWHVHDTHQRHTYIHLYR